MAVLGEADEAHLAGAGPAGATIRPEMSQPYLRAARDLPAVVVVADDRDDAHLAPERGQIGRHAPRAAEAAVLAR
jgi:hypothetical protein